MCVRMPSVPAGWLIAVTMMMIAAARPAAAVESAVDYVEPRVSRTHFEQFVEKLQIEQRQQLVTELLYDDYAAGLADLTARIDQRAEAAGRSRVNAALSGRAFIEPQELRQLRIDVLNVYRESWDGADALFEELLISTESLMTDRTAARFADAARDLRRAVMLHPRTELGREETYAGDGVDVVRLLDEATAPGGELEALDRSSIDPVLLEYEVELDALLRADYPAERAGRLDAAIARIERDDDALRRLEQAALERWRRLYRLNREAVEHIGRIAGQALGETHQQRWLQRFNRVCFPWLFDKTMPEKQYDWIARQRFDDELVAEARMIRDRFVRDFNAECETAIDLILRGRLELGVMISSRTDPTAIDSSAARELYRDLLKSSGRRARLLSDASAALEGLLSERERRRMKADIAALSFRRDRR